MPRLARIYRHPIKALGVEPLDEADLTEGAVLPGDRAWAVAHEAARLSGEWSACANFIRGAKSPSLMAITARTHPDGRLTLSHPDRPDVTIDPATDAAALIDWVAPLANPDRAAPAKLVPAPVGMTDSAFPSISILGLASLTALGDRLGQTLDPRRFRGNLWLDDTAPWAELEWVGRTLAIGAARIEIRERITRCVATHANPETGRPDSDILGTLDTAWDHQEFGVYGVVVQGGRIATGDKVTLQ